MQARRDLPAALGLLATGALALGTVATTIVAWEDAPQAWLDNVSKLVLRR